MPTLNYQKVLSLNPSLPIRSEHGALVLDSFTNADGKLVLLTIPLHLATGQLAVSVHDPADVALSPVNVTYDELGSTTGGL